MSVREFSLVVFLISAVAGFLGSLTGLGGGVVITPVLTLLLGVDLHYAMGASLVSVIATSSGAAAAYVREGFSNVRVGMFLEIATTLGAVAGAHLTAVSASVSIVSAGEAPLMVPVRSPLREAWRFVTEGCPESPRPMAG